MGTCGVFTFKTQSAIARFSRQMTGREFLETLHRSSEGSNRDREKKITETTVLLVTPHGMSSFYFTEQHTLKPVINHILQRRGGLATVHKPRGLDSSPGQTSSVLVGESEQLPILSNVSIFSVHGTVCDLSKHSELGRRRSSSEFLAHPTWKPHFSFAEG